MKQVQYKSISLERKNGMAILTFNRPEALNAVNAELPEEPMDTTNEISKDNNTRVVIITGAGRAFCSGAGMQQEPTRTAEGTSETIDIDGYRGFQGEGESFPGEEGD